MRRGASGCSDRRAADVFGGQGGRWRGWQSPSCFADAKGGGPCEFDVPVQVHVVFMSRRGLGTKSCIAARLTNIWPGSSVWGKELLVPQSAWAYTSGPVRTKAKAFC